MNENTYTPTPNTTSTTLPETTTTTPPIPDRGPSTTTTTSPGPSTLPTPDYPRTSTTPGDTRADLMANDDTATAVMSPADKDALIAQVLTGTSYTGEVAGVGNVAGHDVATKVGEGALMAFPDGSQTPTTGSFDAAEKIMGKP